MIGSFVVVVVVLVVVEVAGHLVVTDPTNYRVSLVLVWVPPVWSLLVVALMLKLMVASELVPLVHRRPRMMRKLRTMKNTGGDSVALVLAQHLAPSRLTSLALGGVGAGRLAVAVEGLEDRASLGPSGGGGSPICMCCALRSSAAVGTSPKLMYREPAMLLWLMTPAYAKMS